MQEWFETLFRRHRGAVRSYALRRGVDPASADDIVAEVFTIAWRRRVEITGGIEAGWLIGVTRNLVAKHWEQQARSVSTEEEALYALLPRQEDYAGACIENDALREAFLRLGREEREILLLSAWDGLGPAELATALGTTVNAATIRLHRARKELEKKFTENVKETRPNTDEGDEASTRARRRKK